MVGGIVCLTSALAMCPAPLDFSRVKREVVNEKAQELLNRSEIAGKQYPRVWKDALVFCAMQKSISPLSMYRTLKSNHAPECLKAWDDWKGKCDASLLKNATNKKWWEELAGLKDSNRLVLLAEFNNTVFLYRRLKLDDALTNFLTSLSKVTCDAIRNACGAALEYEWDHGTVGDPDRGLSIFRATHETTKSIMSEGEPSPAPPAPAVPSEHRPDPKSEGAQQPAKTESDWELARRLQAEETANANAIAEVQAENARIANVVQEQAEEARAVRAQSPPTSRTATQARKKVHFRDSVKRPTGGKAARQGQPSSAPKPLPPAVEGVQSVPGAKAEASNHRSEADQEAIALALVQEAIAREEHQRLMQLHAAGDAPHPRAEDAARNLDRGTTPPNRMASGQSTGRPDKLSHLSDADRAVAKAILAEDTQPRAEAQAASPKLPEGQPALQGHRSSSGSSRSRKRPRRTSPAPAATPARAAAAREQAQAPPKSNVGQSALRGRSSSSRAQTSSRVSRPSVRPLPSSVQPSSTSRSPGPDRGRSGERNLARRSASEPTISSIVPTLQKRTNTGVAARKPQALSAAAVPPIQPLPQGGGDKNPAVGRQALNPPPLSILSTPGSKESNGGWIALAVTFGLFVLGLLYRNQISEWITGLR